MVSIADNDQFIRGGIVDLVTALGFDPEAFESAEYFLQFNRLDHTSCLITDMPMPSMTSALVLRARGQRRS